MQNRRQWNFDRSVNIPTVIALIGMLAGFGGWMLAQERRMTTLEVVDRAYGAQMRATEERAQRDRNELRDDIKEVKAMTTKLIERR